MSILTLIYYVCPSGKNYRPVSLTCITCKLFEHIVCRHILDHVEDHKILTNLQHGFRSGRSCETQLITTTHDLYISSFNSKSQIDVAILDFSKAFDTVPHAGLLGKLEHYGIDSKILLWITNFLNNRKQRVVVDGSFSNFADVEYGVPQGTVLGPLLFLLHINVNDVVINPPSTVRVPRQHWDRADITDRANYHDYLDNLLMSLHLPMECINCTDYCCTDYSHIASIQYQKLQKKSQAGMSMLNPINKSHNFGTLFGRNAVHLEMVKLHKL